jgi:hypothetical protein
MTRYIFVPSLLLFNVASAKRRSHALKAGFPAQILGQEAATKLPAKRTQMATIIEQVVRRRVADLSY